MNLMVFGCGKDESIKTYRVAEPTGKERGTPSATSNVPPFAGNPSVKLPTGPNKVRILGGIIPGGDGTSYFLKFVGPIEKIDPYEKDFDAALNSIRVTGDRTKPVTWTIPPGWREGEPPQAARGMRMVTMSLGSPDKAVDMYLSTPFAGSLLDNVNRWRGEVGLEKVSQEDLPKVVTEVQLGNTKAYRVDYRGPGGSGGMSGPFMNKK